jgi:mannose-1-phosphate guanylyltransferase
MDALILAGGSGTRLRPITFSLPKPLLPLDGKPILQYLLENLKRAGLVNVVLSVGYLGEYLESFCGDGRKLGLRICYVRESTPLGTAGPIRLAEAYWRNSSAFLVVNGDVYTTFDFSRLWKEREQTDADLIVCHYEHKYVSPFGVLQLDDGYVTGIVEKPMTVTRISTGIYLVSAQAARLVPSDRLFTMPDLIRECLARGMKVKGLPIDQFWLGIEHLRDVETALQRLQAAEDELNNTTLEAAAS